MFHDIFLFIPLNLLFNLFLTCGVCFRCVSGGRGGWLSDVPALLLAVVKPEAVTGCHPEGT